MVVGGVSEAGGAIGEGGGSEGVDDRQVSVGGIAVGGTGVKLQLGDAICGRRRGGGRGVNVEGRGKEGLICKRGLLGGRFQSLRSGSQFGNGRMVQIASVFALNQM